MKKIYLLGMILAMLLMCGCNKAEVTAKRSTREIGDMLMASWADEGPFRVADEDFLETNFDEVDGEGVVFFSEGENILECGFFYVNEADDRHDATAALASYIASEKAAVRSLAALYPADELTTRLAAYEAASVGVQGKYVYYIVGDPGKINDFKRDIARIQ